MFLLRNLRYECKQFRRVLKAGKLLRTQKFSAEAVTQSRFSLLLNEKFGQPTASTHPHLINEGELVPGVRKNEFKERRQRLMAILQKHITDNNKLKEVSNQNHLVIIPSSTKKYMSDKIPYLFRQNSDFYYLSGCLEPDTILLVFIDMKSNVTSTLFMRPKDKHAELWDGTRTGVLNAIEMFGVDEAYSVETFEEKLQSIVTKQKPLVWFDPKSSDLSDVSNIVEKVAGTVSNLYTPITFIHALRLYKSAAEQNLMRRTCEIASNAINEVMCESRPGHSEHHLFAMVDYKCRMNNASHLAYPPVVASGNNATTIHYISNSRLTTTGDLVLMDAGCEFGGYTSDITRTWPISGEFTEPQKILYDIIVLLQKELIDNHLLKEGGETLDNLFDTMCIKLGKYLQEAGLVPKDISSDRGYAQAGYKYCPHHVSHYLGMDVHDTPLMPRTLRLLPGMVCTVEPGIYLSPECFEVPPEFRGMGIRIEDDILIKSETEVEVLTHKCLKERKALENAFKEKTSQKQ